MNLSGFNLSEKELAGAEHVLNTNRMLAASFIRKCKAEKLTKAAIAERLGVDKSVVTRMLSGNANLTLRTIGELCWALDVKPEFKAQDFPVNHNRGEAIDYERSTIANQTASTWNVDFAVLVQDKTKTTPMSTTNSHNPARLRTAAL